MDLIKLEIIISNIYLERLIEKLESAGVKGYTAVEITRGKGIKQGEHLSEGLLPTSNNTIIFTICDASKISNIISNIQPFLQERGGMLITYKIEYASGLTS
ncbi:P-II family nitrogen regulator [Nitrosomonas ureae]|uniref:Nitrogen regulatory protein P-II family n=1 Tax=Nitrosomonas ureae TaxID=44577 RepID=A0A286ALV1_9PROT|nr:hypothetical protein [Nitrosomonas ureae]SOD22866.1 hypothetical protein SAMN06297164_3617 [Nitrosomonas ureae]